MLPISEKYEEYAEKVRKELARAGVDVTADNRSEKIGFKIREAQNKKVPYMLIVGANEEADGLVSVRTRSGGDKGQMKLEEFIAKISEEIRTKTIQEP